MITPDEDLRAKRLYAYALDLYRILGIKGQPLLKLARMAIIYQECPSRYA